MAVVVVFLVLRVVAGAGANGSPPGAVSPATAGGTAQGGSLTGNCVPGWENMTASGGYASRQYAGFSTTGGGVTIGGNHYPRRRLSR